MADDDQNFTEENADDRIHTPVLLERTLELLAPAIQRPGAVVVDATLGMGGHAAAMLGRFPELTLVGLDRDTEALAIAGHRLEPFGARFLPVHTEYAGIDDALDSLAIDEIDGILFDLGVSSLQLDHVERGFSYSKDAPLDMRMDTTQGITAQTVIATYSEADLRRIFYQYGEEKLAPRYARRIVERRVDTPLVRSGQLVDLLSDATPAALSRAGHPAKRVFQALRIEVNAELASLETALPKALDRIALGGRVVVLAYQSLEDRLVKRELASRSKSTAPQGLPVELPEHRPEFRLLVRGAELASDQEKDDNPRAKPVRLRSAERIRRTA